MVGLENGVSRKRKLLDTVESGHLVKRTSHLKRKRKRTTGFRTLIKDEIEKALCCKTSPIGHLFQLRNEQGEPVASFLEVTKCLQIDQFKLSQLQPDAIVRISNITNLFNIYKDSTGTLVVSYRPVGDSVEECTVYLDNLPSGCNFPRLERLAKKFGTIVEIKVPKSPSRIVEMRGVPMEFGRRMRSHAFIQYTTKEAADKLIKEYEQNSRLDTLPKKCPSSGNVLELRNKLKKLTGKRKRRTRYEVILITRLRKVLKILLRKEKSAVRKQSKNKKKESGVGMKVQAVDTSFEEKVENHCQMKTSVTVKPQVVTSKKRKRVHRRRVFAASYISSSVASYFEHVQAYPLSQYLQLRQQYLQLRSDSSKMFKKSLRDAFKDKITCPKNNVSIADERDRMWSVKEESSSPS